MNCYRISPESSIYQLLLQLTEQGQTGCLQISDSQVTWSVLLNRGRLFYATNSADPFERFERYLRKLRPQIPTLVNAIRDQMQVLFEPSEHNLGQDYQAIHWLVEQKHLAIAHAALLIEELSKEVIESLLSIKQGDAVLLPFDPVNGPAVFCNLDLPWLLEFCQTRLEEKGQNYQIAPVLTESMETREFSGPSSYSTVQLMNSVAGLGVTKPVATLLPHRSKVQRPFSILCIDRSSAMLNVSDLLLDDEFFSVTVIQDLLGSLIELASSNPDLILLDVSRSKDAYGLCTLLRSYAQFRSIPIIAVGSQTGLVNRLQAKLAGASDYLMKPFTRPQLIKMLFKHLTIS